MKKIFTILLSSFALCSFAQTQIANPGFETWGNTAPGVAGEPRAVGRTGGRPALASACGQMHSFATA